MVEFRQGHLDRAKKGIGLSGGVPAPGINLDPTELFPSVEISKKYNEHFCTGNFYQFNVSPTSFDLDPYFFFKKTDFSLVVRSGNTKDINLKKDPLESGNSYSVQTMVVKGPIYLSGWGYDICGLPVPANQGTDSGRYFSSDAAYNRPNWKTGPVDLRWDDDRKVWVGGPEVIEGKMLTSLPAGNFEAGSIGSGVIYRGRNLQYSKFNITKNENSDIKPDPYGVPISAQYTKNDVPEIVMLVNRNSTVTLASGDYFSAVKINYEWRVMGGGGGGSCVVGKFKKLNCSDPEIQKTAAPNFDLISDPEGEYGQTYYIRFNNLGKKRVFYLKTNNELLKDLIPSDSSGGKLTPANGRLDITEVIPDKGRLPYSGYFSLVQFNNCEKSSDVYTYKFPAVDQYISDTGRYTLVHQKSLNRLFDCPDSSDNFGMVTDDETGSEYYAIHPFKFIKHNVRVIACKSNLTITCNGQKSNAYVITEVDDCANTGTGLSRE